MRGGVIAALKKFLNLNAKLDAKRNVLKNL